MKHALCVTATPEIRKLLGDAGKSPIAALTANTMVGDRQSYLAAGMTDYVSKPINPRELLTLVDKHGAMKRRREATPVEDAAESPDADANGKVEAGEGSDRTGTLG